LFLAVYRFNKGFFYGTDYFSVIRVPALNSFKHFIEAKDIFGPHKVVTKHNEAHFSVYFLQAFKQGVSVAPMAF